MVSRHIPIAIAYALFVFSVTSCSTERTHHQFKPESRDVELLRDTWGVPHIFAETDAGAMYGLGYAVAEDRAFQMYYNLRIIQGRLAELVGDVKIGVSQRLPQGRNSALRNDIKMRTIGYYRAAQRVAAHLGGDTLILLQAYSDGVNDYMEKHPNELLYLFEKYNLEPEPWTPAACIASWWRVALFFSGDGLREMPPYYEIKTGTSKDTVLRAERCRRRPSRPARQGRCIRDPAR